MGSWQNPQLCLTCSSTERELPQQQSLPHLKISATSLGVCAALDGGDPAFLLPVSSPACVCVMMALWGVSAFPRAGWWGGAPLWGVSAAEDSWGQLEGTAWDGGSLTATLCCCWGWSSMASTDWKLLWWGHSCPQSCHSDQSEVPMWFYHQALSPVPSEHFAMTFLQTCTIKLLGSREALAAFVWYFPHQGSLAGLKHTCAMQHQCWIWLQTQLMGRTRAGVSTAIINTFYVSIPNKITIQIVQGFNQLPRVTATNSCWDIWRDFSSVSLQGAIKGVSYFWGGKVNPGSCQVTEVVPRPRSSCCLQPPRHVIVKWAW